MDRRKKLLVNIGEAATDSALREAAERNDARVFAKVRIADVVKIEGSGLANNEYTYALKAHFDFVVADREGGPHFAVEFDEPHHDTDPATIRRDRMKDSIAERLGLPVYRIDAEFLRTSGRTKLVDWLVDLWFLHEAFMEAQDRGEMPMDEPFTYFSFIEWKEDGSAAFPYDLAQPAAVVIAKAHQTGVVANFGPEVLTQWDRDVKDNYSTAHAILPLVVGGLVIGRARCRLFSRSPGMPVSARDLSHDLAIADVADKLAEIERGELLPAGKEQLAALRAETDGWIREGVLLDDVPPPDYERMIRGQ